MKKKWLALVPAVALVAAPLPFQSADATSQDQPVQMTELAEVPEGYDAILEWPPHEQPILKQGSGPTFEVEFVQAMLVHFGYDTDVDGYFGPDTHEQLMNLQAEHGLAADGIVGVNTWTLLMEEYAGNAFSPETAIIIAEEHFDNDDLIFSSDGEKQQDAEGKDYYQLKAQSQDLIDSGGSGTVGFYNVYESGDVIFVEPTQ